jgi:hypothetical protein
MNELEKKLNDVLKIVEDDGQSTKGTTQSGNKPSFGAYKGGAKVHSKRQKPSKTKAPDNYD